MFFSYRFYFVYHNKKQEKYRRRGFKGSRVQGFQGSRIPGFEDSRIRGFEEPFPLSCICIEKAYLSTIQVILGSLLGRLFCI